MKHYSVITLIIIIFSSCTAAKLSVPDKFKSQATEMHVKGLNGWMINQTLQFGEYQTSKVKRGWDFKGGFQHTKFNIRPEEMVLRVFNIETDKRTITQRNKFQFTIEDGQQTAEVFAMEKFKENQLVYKSNNPYLGDVSATKNYEYAFSAAILPIRNTDNEPWSLVLINRYDAKNDTARNLFDRPYVEEEGYASNGKESIAIRPLNIDKVTTANGRNTKVFGGKILSGYELRIDNSVIAVIDILDNNVWVYNDLDPSTKLIVSAITSSILLKRIQDVRKDTDQE